MMLLRMRRNRGRIPLLVISGIVWGIAFGVLSGIVANSSHAQTDESASGAPLRLISLNPSLTAIVLRLGAADRLVGVDDYSARVLPELADRPRVGGLFDPSLESVVALRPDRVLIVAGIDQESHAARLEKLGIVVEIYQNERLDEVLENIERIGALLSRQGIAADRIRAILEMREAVALAARGRARPSTLAVVTRSPLFVVGAETFLDEMLAAVGADNLGRRLAKGYPRASIEWLIGVRPDLLLDMTPDVESAGEFWSRWPSLPAVQANRVVDVDASRISLPGPDLDQALRALAVAVHGQGISAAIDQALDLGRVGGLAAARDDENVRAVVGAEEVGAAESTLGSAADSGGSRR